ncbi:MAG: hypothetical protein ACETWM_01755 [Candidatus Lokiarchaeia archaeon]
MASKKVSRSLYVFLLFCIAVIVVFIGVYLVNIGNINRSYYKANTTGNRIALRKFPYPYKAAMTICSDIDGTTTKEEFLEIQKFLNTREQTSMGEGVGLEIGNSFVMYAPPTCAFSYFSGNPGDAQIIRKFIKAGYIDFMHSYGEKMNFTRQDAIKAIEELNNNQCKVDVWVDHAKTPDNLGDDRTFGLGDHPNSIAYHSDLTLAYGIKFVWLGRVTPVIGQSVPISLKTFSSIYDSRHPLHSLINIGKEFAKNVLAVFGNEKYAMHKNYDLIKIAKLDDGQKAYEFLRFDNYWKGVATGATSKRLSYAISQRTLERLKEVGGYTVVYTHLGKNSDSSQVIPKETQVALRDLANEYEKGNIYITTTSKLLNYYVHQKYLNWSYETKGDKIIITISSVEDPVFGSLVPTIQDLQGITFYVPDKDKARIYISDKEIAELRRNSPDYTGRESVMILY